MACQTQPQPTDLNLPTPGNFVVFVIYYTNNHFVSLHGEVVYDYNRM